MKIKELLQTKEYDFLRTNPTLNENICLLTLGGSFSYGTNVSNSQHESDIDIRGIYLPTKKDILNLNVKDDLYEDKITDSVIYSLTKIINLLKNANPNVLEILGTKDEHVIYINEIGKMIRDNSDIFLSQRVINSYGNYAMQQMNRCKNALANDKYSNNKEQLILDKINLQIKNLEEKFKKLTNEEINLYIDKSDKDNYDKEIFMDLNLKHYPFRDFKYIYNDMNQIVRTYDKIENIKNNKDDIHLYKHCMHLIRLLISGTMILEGKGIVTYMYEHIPLLLDIRNGKYTFEEIFIMAEEYMKKFEYAAKNNLLPQMPDEDSINQLTIEIAKKILY